MTKLTPEKVSCPVCGRFYSNRGLQNHINKCNKISSCEKETIRRIRHLPK
jgi:NAD-dependent DNA ligase